MVKKGIKILLQIFLVQLIIPVVMFGQAPPPPPGGPGSGDPPIGGTVPVDDGVIFLLLLAVIYVAVKLYQTKYKNSLNELKE